MRVAQVSFGLAVAVALSSSCGVFQRDPDRRESSTRRASAHTAATTPPTAPRRIVIPAPQGMVADSTHRFSYTSDHISAAIAARVSGSSWRPGCPVPLEQLRYVRLSYWGFDGLPHTGELIVHADAVGTIATAFRRMHAARFRIAKMQLVDDFGADDDRSTQANNTSAFNCRAVTGGGRFSQHSYGRAIDINPVQNPYVYADGNVLDPAARPYISRSPVRTGMIVDGDVVATAFSEAGWGWGGNFKSFKDYQHFSANGG